ncbi:unnamed protein product, partial [Rotaria socialis]
LQAYFFSTNDIETSKKNLFLQRQYSITSTSTSDSFSAISSTSSDSNEINVNGLHKKKKLNGNCKATATTNGCEESIEDETTVCNGKYRPNM